MDSRPVPATSVLFSGVLCIIGGAAAILVALLVGLAAGAASSPQPGAITPQVRIVMRIIMLSLLAAGALGVFMGIGVMSLKNWARKAIATCSGAAVVISVLCLYASLAMIAIPASPEITPRVVHILWGSFLGISLISFGMGIWLVVLFTRASVVACFAGSTEATVDPASIAPRCPLALALFAGYYIAVVVITVSAIAVPERIPDMLFGRAIFGPARNLYALIIGGLCLVAAIGLFRLKAWGLNLAIGIEAFSLTKRLVNILDPRSIQTMRNALAAMAMHGDKAPASDPTLHFRYLESLGLGFSLAMILLLLLSRTQFLKAAAARDSSS